MGIADVNIEVKGASARSTTDSNGHFKIDAKIGDSLVFSRNGYESKTIILSNLTSLSITLEPTSATKLEDVIIVGYGTQRKQDLTGSVSSINAKDFNQQQITSVSQILQGRSPGIQVSDNSGAPGGSTTVRVRGNNSIVGDNSPLYVIDGFVGGSMSFLNPADIQNVEILKDASATAVYGSRGANGVIIITTKKGNSNRPIIELNTAYSRSSVIKKLDLLNNVDYAKTMNANLIGNGKTAIFSDVQIDSIAKTSGTNWQNEIFRNAPSQQYQLGLSGGSGKSTYYVSGEYLDQQGIIINSYRKRYALRGNLNSQISEKFALRLNTFLSRNEVNNSGLAGRGSPVNQAIAWSPLVSVRNSLGDYVQVDPYGSIIGSNPVGIASEQNNKVNNTNALAILGLNYKIANGLTFDVTEAVNYTNQQNLTNATKYANGNNPATASRSSAEMIGLQNTNNLTYTTTINGVHHLTATAVFEYQKYTSDGFSGNASNLTFPEQGAHGLGLNGGSSLSSNFSNWSLLSWIGRVNYDFNRQYFITATLRRDGSSKFYDGNQYSSFPSLGLGIDLSKYDFIQKLGFFDNLKFRGGYGATGNQAINPYQTLLAYSTVNSTLTTGTLTSGLILGNPGNLNLKWETTKQVDVGFDASMFKGRLALSIDYYNKKTSDLLFNVPIPDYLGGGFTLQNVGSVNNHGWDFSINGDVVRNNNFKWTSAANFSILRNKVTKLDGELTQIASTSGALGVGNVGAGLSVQQEYELIVGKPLATYWGLEYLGTWKPSEAAEAASFGNKPGDSRYLDYNEDGKIDGNDYHDVGSGLPRYSWGWNNTFTWKSLTLNVLIQSLGGYKKLNYTYAAGITANADTRQATIADIKDRYIAGTNETSNIPAFSSTNINYTQSTRFLENGTFVRVKNISLSYDIPKSKLKFLDLSIFARASNLFTITKYKGFDPESTNTTGAAGRDVAQGIDYGSYPNAKTYTFGLKLNF